MTGSVRTFERGIALIVEGDRKDVLSSVFGAMLVMLVHLLIWIKSCWTGMCAS